MKKTHFLFSSLAIYILAISACAPVSSSSSSSSSECNDMWCDVSEEDNESSAYVPPVVEMTQDNSTSYELEDVSNANGSMSYEIFVRSFYDSDNDGIGDFKGIEAKLTYLKSLGINTIWLMPIHPSPTYHGYDVMNYYEVNPQYGTMKDFKDLLAEAHNQGINIIIDMVLNHSSRQHPWLAQSYQDKINEVSGENSKADWYVWSEKGRTNYHQYQNLYYEGQFDYGMPDLNFDSPTLRKEIEKIIKYWAEDIGVDGFRLDAVKYYYMNQTSKNNEVLTWIKQTATSVNPDFYLVGECWDSAEIIENYYKSECDSFFKFNTSLEGVGAETILGQVKKTMRSNSFGESIERREKTIKEKNPNGYYSYFLANHDTDRASVSFKGNNAKMAASLYCLLPGMPYMYYGEEIELKGMRLANDHSDARRRLPMIWSKDDKVGECEFPETSRQDLNNNEQVELGVYDQEVDPFSLLNHYRKVANVRNKYPIMKHGVFKNRCADLNTLDEHVLAYEISLDNEKIVIIHNFNDYNVEVDVSSIGSTIDSEINTGHYLPEINNGKLKLGMYSTVVIK